MSHAILIAGHGSRDADGVAEFLDLARHFRTHRLRSKPLAKAKSPEKSVCPV